MRGSSQGFVAYAFLIFRSEKTFLASLALFALLLFISWFVAQTAIIETKEATASLMGEASRLFCCLGPAFLLSSFLSNLRQTGEQHLWLTGNLSRLSYLMNSFYIGSLLSLLSCILSAIFVGLALNNLSIHWFTSLFLESLTLLSITLFFTLNLKSLLKTQILITLIYFLGRLKGFIILSISSPWVGYEKGSSIITQLLLSPLPNFALFDHNPLTAMPIISFIPETLLTLSFFLCLTHLTFRKQCL